MLKRTLSAGRLKVIAAIPLAFFLALLSPGQTTAQTAPIQVLVSNGLKGTMEALAPQIEKAVGHPVKMDFHSTAAVKTMIEAGSAFDVTLITTEAIAELTKAGKLATGSSAELGRSQLGIGIRAGSAKPDIHTAAALKTAFLNAKSITYPKDGASRDFIEKSFEKMGIAAQVKPKIILANGSGPATQSVADGKAEMVVTLFSEIVPIPGVEILGALPGDYAYDVRFSAASSTGAKDKAAAKALIAYLASPAVASTFKAKGVEHR